MRHTVVRLEVENAEDDLVQKTEVAITMMKAVLENVSSPLYLFWSTVNWICPQPDSLKNLNELVKAQLAYFATATEALQTAQGVIEELAVASEGEYR